MCSCCICCTCIDKVFQGVFPETIEFVEEDLKSTETIFKEKEETNQMTTNLFRILGFFMMLIGIGLLFSPIITLINFIPLIGTFLGYGVAIAVWIFAFIMAVVLTAFTIGVAWIFYRPLLGLCLLLVVGGGIALLFV